MANRWEEVLEVTEQLGAWSKVQSNRKMRYLDKVEDGVFYREFYKFGNDYGYKWKATLQQIDPLRQRILWKKDKELRYAFAVQDCYVPKIKDKYYQLVVIPGDIVADDAMACVVLQHLEGCRRRIDDGALCGATPLERLKEKLGRILLPNMKLEENHVKFDTELCWRELARTKEQNTYEERLLNPDCNAKQETAVLLAVQNTPGIDIAYRNKVGRAILQVPVFGRECLLREGNFVAYPGGTLRVVTGEQR